MATAPESFLPGACDIGFAPGLLNSAGLYEHRRLRVGDYHKSRHASEGATQTLAEGFRIESAETFI